MKHNLFRGAAILLTAVGAIVASSASIFVFNQPRTPKSLR